MLYSDIEHPHQPELLRHDTESSEANFIAESIKNKLEYGAFESEIVVLYRTNFQSRIFESIFALKQIPYQVIGSFSFFKRSEIKDMIA